MHLLKGRHLGNVPHGNVVALVGASRGAAAHRSFQLCQVIWCEDRRAQQRKPSDEYDKDLLRRHRVIALPAHFERDEHYREKERQGFKAREEKRECHLRRVAAACGVKIERR